MDTIRTILVFYGLRYAIILYGAEIAHDIYLNGEVKTFDKIMAL